MPRIRYPRYKYVITWKDPNTGKRRQESVSSWRMAKQVYDQLVNMGVKSLRLQRRPLTGRGRRRDVLRAQYRQPPRGDDPAERQTRPAVRTRTVRKSAVRR